MGMSTPIRELFDADYDIDAESGVEVAKNSETIFDRYKTYLILFVVACVVLKLPIAKIRASLPPSVSRLGDVPIQALMVTVLQFAVLLATESR